MSDSSSTPQPLATNVYIDGFNVYYACWKNWNDPKCHEFKATGPFKWLDIRSLCGALYPNDLIHRIYFCTSKVKGSRQDPNKPLRQELYFRALRNTEMFEIHLGHFEEREKSGYLAEPLPCKQVNSCVAPGKGLKIVAREEKGSDVNVATYLLRDAFMGKFEQAVVISNDSDLASAIRVVRNDAKLPIHVISPGLTVVRQLRSAATTAALLDKTLIPNHQLPPTLTLKDGSTISKPHSW
jgi:uncharacterized LabA/DUF88 family protein